jgi:type II secretory pathway pseudopilin PulG
MLEMIISLAMMAIIFAAILPQFRNIQNSWASKQSNAETLQNGRILISHLNQNLVKAVQITAVSDPCDTTGYIEFEGNDGTTYRFDIGANNYVQFGPVGNLADLAGPVSQLQFTCYTLYDLDTPTTDVDTIRLVNVETILTNAGPGQDKSFTTAAYLRINASVASGLIGHWRFDETSGLTAADSSGYGNNGALIYMGGSRWTTGLVDGALDFDGYNDHVDCGNDTELQLTSELTIAAWIKADAWTYGRYVNTIARKGGITPVNYQLCIADEKVMLGLDDMDENDGVRGDTLLVTGLWYHVAATWDGVKVRIYVDGILDNFPPDVRHGTIGTDTRPLCIGGRLGEDYFNGIIDNVRIYNRALSDDEIAQLAGTRAGLMGQWKFDEGSGQIATDSSGNSNDGQLGSSAGPDASDPTWTTDPLMGSVLSFDGSDDYITGIGDCPTGSFTVAGWAKDTGPIIGNKWSVLYSADQEIWFGVDREASQTVWLDVGGNGKGACTTPGTWTRDVWHHLAGTWDESKVHIYIDGVDMSITKYGNPENPQAKPAVIGAWSTHTKDETWDGLLDDVRIYHRALTETEIQAIYNQSEYCCSIDDEILP